VWKDFPVLPSWLTASLHDAPPPTLALPLDVWQVWHAQKLDSLMGTPGTPYFLAFILHSTDLRSVPTIHLYPWTVEALKLKQGLLSRSPNVQPAQPAHTALFPHHCESQILQVTSFNHTLFGIKLTANTTVLFGRVASSPASLGPSLHGLGKFPLLPWLCLLKNGKVTSLILAKSLLVSIMPKLRFKPPLQLSPIL